MKIALDFDGTLAYTQDLWVHEFNKQHPSKKAINSDVKSWGFFDKDPFNITTEEAFEIFDFCWRHWELMKPLEVDQGLKIEELKKLGKVHIVTSIIKNKESIKKWLTEHEIQVDDTVFDQEKWKLGYDIYIDDSPIVAKEVDKVGKICLLYDQLWNRDVKDNKNIKHVYNLNHAIDLIKRLKE